MAIDELAEGVEAGQDRRHHLVHFQGVLEIGSYDPFLRLVE
jgi:hypothetical protein